MIFSAKTFIPDENGELAQAADPSQGEIFSEIPKDPSSLGWENTNNLPPGDYGLAFVKMFLTLIVLIVLFGLTIWFLRRLIRSRLQKGSGTQMIEVLEKKMISPKTMLYLLEIEGKKIVLAESHLEVRPILELKNLDPIDPNSSALREQD